MATVSCKTAFIHTQKCLSVYSMNHSSNIYQARPLNNHRTISHVTQIFKSDYKTRFSKTRKKSKCTSLETFYSLYKSVKSKKIVNTIRFFELVFSSVFPKCSYKFVYVTCFALSTLETNKYRNRNDS